MTNYVGDVGCGARSHARDMAIYDRQPRWLRDLLKRCRVNQCSGCSERMRKRDGKEPTQRWFDSERVNREVYVGGKRVLMREEELRP